MIMIANLQYAWTLFVKPLQAGTGWKLSDIQLAFTLFILFQTWVQPLEGWLIDRLGPRGFISARRRAVRRRLGRAGHGDDAADALRAVRRRRHRRGVRLQRVDRVGAEVVHGASAGWRRASWRPGSAAARRSSFRSSRRMIARAAISTAFLCTGIFQGLVILVVAQFLRHPPPRAGGAAKAAVGGARRWASISSRPREMLRTPQFYVLYAMFVLMATGGLLVTAQAGPMAQSWGIRAGGARRWPRRSRRWPTAPAASSGAGSRTASAARTRWASRSCCRRSACVLVLTVGRLSGALFAVDAGARRSSPGARSSRSSRRRRRLLRHAHATSNYGVLYTAKGVASIIGGGLGALLFERFGSWTAGFYGSAVMALVAPPCIALRPARVASAASAIAVGVPATAK